MIEREQTGNRHRKPTTLSAGVVVVRRMRGEYRVLLLRIFRYWDFPKGRVEAGEHPLQAARREVAEETGLTDLSFRWGKSYRETQPYARGKVARYYLAESSGGVVTLPVNPALGRPEHHEFRWLSFEDAERFLGDRLKPILAWAKKQLLETAPQRV